ncbi:MAG: flavin reductase family protein [Clostridia bacterium]|nr:flavin reductase family protein [Clostridia bacterium]
MRKNFGKKTWFYPMPVVIIGTYDENGKANAMNAAWSGVYDYNQVYISLSPHKTTDNIKLKKEFTISFATADTVVAADYVGVVSANKVPNKVEVAGLHESKAEFVDAPYFDEFPLTLECKLVSMEDVVVAEIVNVSADEKILTNGTVDPAKLKPITFDPINNTYIELGNIVGKAFSDGLKLK